MRLNFLYHSPIIESVPLPDVALRNCRSDDGVQWNGPVTCFVCGCKGFKTRNGEKV